MHFKILRTLASALLVTIAACSGGEERAAPAGAAADARRVDPGQAGTVSGRVRFEGDVPVNPSVRISGDPMCIRANPNGMTFENFMVSGGGLDNVFVYVKDGLGGYQFDVPSEPVKLDQQGCRYVPHVAGLQVGQPLEISNSDETMHNVHSLPEANGEFNFAQYVKGQKNVQTFTTSEVMVPFKCDLHGWMNAYVGVVEHPYFAVTTEGGKFELKNLPAGTYTVEAWHEKAGTRTQQVTIAANESKAIDFTFTSASPAN
ncbi:MAG TPA: carboxypeptidase regulatory-like domain-containing protein [Vicinamibacterales bacterium]|nr:carboxypeptidase regulatory-like domain-containing protein [Vicinamibacterales bacterium]